MLVNRNSNDYKSKSPWKEQETRVVRQKIFHFTRPWHKKYHTCIANQFSIRLERLENAIMSFPYWSVFHDHFHPLRPSYLPSTMTAPSAHDIKQPNRNRSYQTKHNRENPDEKKRLLIAIRFHARHIRKAVNHGHKFSSAGSGTCFYTIPGPPKSMTPQPTPAFSFHTA